MDRAPFAHGIVHDLDIETYHAMPSISNSQLNDLALSPRHFYALNRDPHRPARTEKSGQLEGNLAHCAILEPDEFSSRYVVIPKQAPKRPTEAQWNAEKPSKASKEAMDWWTDFNARNEGKRVISIYQYDTAWRQAESVRALGEVGDMLRKGSAEVSAFWVDPTTGVECRCRPDFVHPLSSSSVAILDVKTFSRASAEEFCRQVARKRYFQQDAFYSAGYSAASNMTVEDFQFIAVETEYPFAAASYRLSPASREEGFSECRRLLDTYEECVRTSNWPSYSTRTTEIELPPYAFSSQEVEISYV